MYHLIAFSVPRGAVPLGDDALLNGDYFSLFLTLFPFPTFTNLSLTCFLPFLPPLPVDGSVKVIYIFSVKVHKIEFKSHRFARPILQESCLCVINYFYKQILIIISMKYECVSISIRANSSSIYFPLVV